MPYPRGPLPLSPPSVSRGSSTRKLSTTAPTTASRFWSGSPRRRLETRDSEAPLAEFNLDKEEMEVRELRNKVQEKQRSIEMYKRKIQRKKELVS